jgi:ATP-dependent exoDNAse (exonuclease V) beta subunit
VHQVLAGLDLSEDPTGLQKDDIRALANNYAKRNGVVEHAVLVGRCVLNALESPTVRLSSRNRHWQELFVAAPDRQRRDIGGPGSPTIEGYVDLVIEVDGELVVVDYKTEAYDDEEDAARRALAHSAQLGLYASALGEATGLTVGRSVIIFVNGDSHREVEIAVEPPR